MKRKDAASIHPTMHLLYRVTESHLGISGPTQIANLFNVAHGTVNKWEERGVPAQIAIYAQRILGIDASLLSPGENLPSSSVHWQSNPKHDALRLLDEVPADKWPLVFQLIKAVTKSVQD